MSFDQQIYNGSFFLAIGTLVCGFLSLIVRYALKSKCSETNICFGCLSIKRDTEGEIKEEMKQLEYAPVGTPGTRRTSTMSDNAV